MKKTLAELRNERNLSQRELAKRLGVTPGAVGNWEAGHRTPRLHMAKRIAGFFNVRIDDIDFGIDGNEQQRERNTHVKAG